MRNRQLLKIYNKIYKKGEESHYTRLRFAKGKLTLDKKAVLGELPWKGKRVLDLGCGTGQLAHLIAKRKAKYVLGIDYSAEAIKNARAKYNLPNLFFEKKDLRNIKGKFDAVISLGTLEHTGQPFLALKKISRLVKFPGGSVIVTCPNWVNPRGYMLQTLWRLFRARITLADLHYLTPIEFEAWAKKLGMKLRWRTVDHDWAHGRRLVEDFRKRIPNVLRDSKLPCRREYIDDFVHWIETHVVPLERNTRFGGVTGVYHFKK